MTLKNRRRTIFPILVLTVFFTGIVVNGQGCPENVMLVVNSQSKTSMLLANHYVALRNIPSSHVVYLDEVPARETIPELTFREKIIQPILATIESRELSDCVDYIVYSSDFPTTVSISSIRQRLLEQAVNQNRPLNAQAEKIYSQAASLTSLTYFAKQFVANDPSLMLLNANFYMRNPTDTANLGSRSFHHVDIWAPNGTLAENPNQGHQYFISTMLNVTRNFGLNEQQAVDALRNSVNADNDPPEGIVYFCENAGARTAPRIKYFRDVATELNQLGVETKRIKTILPTNAQIAGIVAGFPKANLDERGNQYSHGSICDNLTSIGGKFTSNSQTKCTEFIRKGAAGSNGCVAEPFAIAKKFPHPMIQVHYAKGCTLGEAYYQSIHGPYQNLIVGDPLCRPYGKRPQFEIRGINKFQQVDGQLTLLCEQTGDNEIGQLHAYLDGKKLSRDSTRIHQIDFDSRQFSDGYHELSFVGVVDGPVEINSRIVIPITINNLAQDVRIQCDKENVQAGKTLKITVESELSPVRIVHNGRVLASSPKKKNQFEIDTEALGRGPVRIQATAGDGKSKPIVWSRPTFLDIEATLSTKVPQPHLPKKKRSN